MKPWQNFNESWKKPKTVGGDEEKEEDRKKGGGGGASVSTGGNKKKEKQDPNIEVVVIKDEPVKKTPSESVAKNQEEIKNYKQRQRQNHYKLKRK